MSLERVNCVTMNVRLALHSLARRSQICVELHMHVQSEFEKLEPVCMWSYIALRDRHILRVLRKTCALHKSVWLLRLINVEH